MHTPIPQNDIVFGWGRSAAMTETVRFKGNGNVGIGTTAPAASLHVNNDTTSPVGIISGSSTAGTGFDLWNTMLPPPSFNINSWSSRWRLVTTPPVFSGAPPFVPFQQFGGGDLSFSSVDNTGVVASPAMTITRSGRVGIGNTSPTAALHVSGSTFFSYVLEATLEATGASNQPGNTRSDRPFSIVSDSNILALAFDVRSDERIKNIIQRSDSTIDLAILQAIDVTDYAFKDYIENGKSPQKKVIAQQVERVFPQAVSKSIGVVPDIYQKAQLKDGWVALATDLKPGERVRLIGEKSEGIHEVLEIAEGKFRTDFTTSGDQVFVYGREVDDFRSVDYDAIAMLNVSATQQIKKEKDAEVNALREENTALRARVAALEAKDQARDAKIASIERLLESSAQPAARTVSIKLDHEAR
jgi:hypothetical protein